MQKEVALQVKQGSSTIPPPTVMILLYFTRSYTGSRGREDRFGLVVYLDVLLAAVHVYSSCRNPEPASLGTLMLYPRFILYVKIATA